VVRERPGRRPERSEGHDAQDARQGEIVLRTRRRRWVFFGGLVACVILAFLLATLAP
jgi:uncharacterized protein involved in exopolysaccharide biosynthesis